MEYALILLAIALDYHQQRRKHELARLRERRAVHRISGSVGRCISDDVSNRKGNGVG